MRTVTFQVTPWRNMCVWRKIELTESQTLDDVHNAIQNAFELGNDHPYAFFLNNHAFDRVFEYGGPGVSAPHAARDAQLSSLPLRVNKRLPYLFDFGDELRHEVKMVGEDLAEEGVKYPRIVASEGKAPPQYEDFDRNEDDQEASWAECTHPEPPADPGLSELVPAIKNCVDAFYKRRDFSRPGRRKRPAIPRRDEEDVLRERDLALALIERSGGDVVAIHAHVEHPLEGTVWGWLSKVPNELARIERHEDALALNQKLSSVWSQKDLILNLPLLLARAGRSADAVQRADTVLAEHPDEPEALLRCAEAFLELCDTERAEQCYRDGLVWVGSNFHLRDDLVRGLAGMLNVLGREDEATAVLREAEQFEQQLDEERARAMGLSRPPTVRREGPKIGRNAPCPCGSGKKHKKCCGKPA